VRIAAGMQSALRTIWFDRRPHTYHFIHIPKNGGRSIRRALSMRPEVSLSKEYHHRYVDIAGRIGRDLQYFSVIRNPWSRTASRYVFGKNNARKWPDSDPRKQYLTNATFRDYVTEQRILPIPEHPNAPWMGPLSSWFNQIEWIRDEAGNVVCDCLRLETIDSDISAYFGRKLSIPHRESTRTATYDYRKMYTDDLAEIVGNTFHQDIEYFGFSFDGPATRNVYVMQAPSCRSGRHGMRDVRSIAQR